MKKFLGALILSLSLLFGYAFADAPQFNPWSMTQSVKISGNNLIMGCVYSMVPNAGLVLTSASSIGTQPAICIADSPTSCVVSGVVFYSNMQGAGFSPVGNPVYVAPITTDANGVSSYGSITTTPPSAPTYLYGQSVGTVLDPNTVLVIIGPVYPVAATTGPTTTVVTSTSTTSSATTTVLTSTTSSSSSTSSLSTTVLTSSTTTVSTSVLTTTSSSTSSSTSTVSTTTTVASTSSVLTTTVLTTTSAVTTTTIVASCTYPVWQQNPNMTISGNGLTIAPVTAYSFTTALATESFTTGLWYWEYQVISAVGDVFSGVAINGVNLSVDLGTDQYGWSYEMSNGHKNHYGTSLIYGSSYTAGSIIQVAVDAINGCIYFGLNGTWQNGGVPTSGASGALCTGAAFTGIKGSIYPAVGFYTAAGSDISRPTITATFAPPFAETVPAGYSPVCQ